MYYHTQPSDCTILLSGPGLSAQLVRLGRPVCHAQWAADGSAETVAMSACLLICTTCFAAGHSRQAGRQEHSLLV